MTKLDETLKFGGVYNLLSQAGIPVSYLSAGQRVPEDLEVATRQRLVELVLGKLATPMDAESKEFAEVAR